MKPRQPNKIEYRNPTSSAHTHTTCIRSFRREFFCLTVPKSFVEGMLSCLRERVRGWQKMNLHTLEEIAWETFREK